MLRKPTLLSDGISTLEKTATTLCPPTREGEYRTLILLFDGTGDTDDEDVTNVIEIRNMLYGHITPAPDKQLVFYQRGIGTYNPHLPNAEMKIPIVDSISGLVDKAIAWSLRHHVLDGYNWLIKNYREGDRICMFGFSRGAYTARALAGMLSKVGLLPLSHKHARNKAFDSYKTSGPQAMQQSWEFKKRMGCREVTVEFLGAWDTVNSVGLITARRLPFTAYNRVVKTFRHAVALDERRARFRTNMWSQPKERAVPGNRQNGPVSRSQNGQNEERDHSETTTSHRTAGTNEVRVREKEPSSIRPKLDVRPSSISFKPDVDQVWFSGCHCDVGGGSVLNGTRPNLSHIPLRWMVRECFKANTGIIFYTAKLSAIGLDPEALVPVVKSRPDGVIPSPSHTVKHRPPAPPPMISRARSWISSCFSGASSEIVDMSIYSTYSEEELDLVDSLAPIFDQLAVKRGRWWLLETYPLKVWSSSKSKYVRKKNVGSGRNIAPPLDASATFKGEPVDPRWCKIRIHRSVKTRMECEGHDGSRYVPKALLDGKTLDKVDTRLIEWVD